ncbi:hypothetical protein AB0J57_32320 [Streptomyces sp. NPDC049837]|uniref:hypothetical protein n=1 Tax=Streptomyces sp. NPDC049837 TaxID=3155277 RepID=UPI00341F91D9
MDVDGFARGAGPAIRDMIAALGGDLQVFDRDPLTAVPLLDDFVLRSPWAQFEEDDWVWLHTQLTAFVAEVLVRVYGGVWKARTDPGAPLGWVPVIEVLGADGLPRQVPVMAVVYEELHPVPQRIPRLIERAVGLAGHGPRPQSGLTSSIRTVSSSWRPEW